MKKHKLLSSVFDALGKGGFVCSNSIDEKQQKLYNYIDQDFDFLYDYFIEIDFVLERGDEYFMFSRVEAKADLERKMERVFKWVDIIDFFKAFENSFGPGTRFTPSEIVVKADLDIALKSKLEYLRKYTNENSFSKSVEKLIEMLRKEGFCELENEITNSHKVLSSFTYIEKLILAINIPEEVQNEIPE